MLSRPPRWVARTFGLAALVAITSSSACAFGGGRREPPPTPAHITPPEGEWEYVIVGSGAGGGPLAARLAREGRRVLLLEAGNDVADSLDYQVPARHAISTENADRAWWFFVSHHADHAIDQMDSKWQEEGILYPRGSALGGSTAVNAMVTVLPSRSDWDRLADLSGESNFRAQVMDRYIDRVREWLPIEEPDSTLALADSTIVNYLRAAAESNAGEIPSATDLASWFAAGGDLGTLLAHDINESLRVNETTGLFRLPLATHLGHRAGTRERVLDTVAAGYPLTVQTGSFVTRILFDDPSTETPRAIGVEYVRAEQVYGASLAQVDAPSEREQVYASAEVVISAGVFNSPQLLMLSGIGDPEQLATYGIDLVHALPGVGRNLQDRVEVAVVSEFGAPLEVVEHCDLVGSAFFDACQDDWNHGQGVYRTSGFLATVLRRSTDSVSLADLQIFASPSDIQGYFPGYSIVAATPKNRVSWLILKAHTTNRDGTVRLSSASPFTRPSIELNYFDESNPLADSDLRAVVEGVKFVRRIEARMRELNVDDPPVEVWPGADIASDDDIAAWVRREAWGHHASCTNRMGRGDDPDAVVDSRFRVLGVDGLRVVDASVFPQIPGTFIAYPLFMLSERAADIMMEDHP